VCHGIRKQTNGTHEFNLTEFVHFDNYYTIEATIARVNKVKKAFGQYVNKSEGVNRGQKPMKIRKSKTFFKPIVKPNIQMIFDDIATLKNNYNNELLQLKTNY